jgi:hypothetical protein
MIACYLSNEKARRGEPAGFNFMAKAQPTSEIPVHPR